MAHPESAPKFPQPAGTSQKKGVTSMTKIVRDLRIKAPVDKIFNFLADPRNLPEIWPNIVEVNNLKKSKGNDSYTFDWTYKMSGTRFEAKAETAEFVQNQRLVFQSTKGFDCTLNWKFQPEMNETRLLLEFEYKTPALLLKKLKEQTILLENEHDLEAVLENVKSRAELELAYA
jgi:uncharacterized membrane protein